MLDALFSIFYCTLGIGYKNSKMTKLLVTIFLYSLWLTLATAEGVRSGQELVVTGEELFAIKTFVCTS